MNTYSKFAPNVFVAKCTEKHEKEEVIPVETQYGKTNNCIVFNLVGQKDGYYYYSILREDGMDAREWAKIKAEKLQTAALNAEKKSNSYWKASNEGAEFLSLGEPIKVGHHSEKRHRALIERNHNRMSKSVEFSKQAEEYKEKAAYYAGKEATINLSMPESLEFYEFELERLKKAHDGLKDGSIKREHSYSMTYAKKDVNEMEKKLKLAKLLWA